MAMSTLEYDVVNQIAAMARKILHEVYPELQGLQQIYDAEGGIQDTLTQAELDEISTFSGLTVQQVTDAAYVMTAVLLPGITAGYPALAQLAARDRGFAPPPPLMPVTPAPMAAGSAAGGSGA